MLTKDQVGHVANLAKLELTELELSKFGSQMDAILGHFEELRKINTDNVAPLVNPTEISQHQRSDELKKSFTIEELLQNAPDSLGNLFKVPPVV